MGLINDTAGSGQESQIFPQYADNKGYFRINDSGGKLGSSAGVTVTNGKGHFTANRNAASGTTSSRDIGTQWTKVLPP